jgi:hypothetical protein
MTFYDEMEEAWEEAARDYLRRFDEVRKTTEILSVHQTIASRIEPRVS